MKGRLKVAPFVRVVTAHIKLKRLVQCEGEGDGRLSQITEVGLDSI